VQKPNIVLFLTDDMPADDDLRFMLQTQLLLGGTGVTFDHACSPNPLRCPARAELVTDQYTHNNGVHSNSGAWGAMKALKYPDNNIGVRLQNAGGQSVLTTMDEPTPRAFPIEGAAAKDPSTHEWGWQGAHWGRYSFMRYWDGGQELYDTRPGPGGRRRTS
jgi:arylsulfatase A-like enzyme